MLTIFQFPSLKKKSPKIIKIYKNKKYIFTNKKLKKKNKKKKSQKMKTILNKELDPKIFGKEKKLKTKI